MKNKVVLITGGGSGIGKAIARRFIKLNAYVVITGRRESQLAETCKDLGKNASYIAGDLTGSGVARKTIQEVVGKHGRLDVLVNNAGAAKHGLLVEVSDEDIDFLLKTNVFAPLALTREALPELIKTKGSVVNISSILTKGVMPEASVYSATKAAVDHMTRVLAKEYGSKGVRVNAVAPGLTATDMTKEIREQKELLEFWENKSPFGRIGQPDEVAAGRCFSCRRRCAMGNRPSYSSWWWSYAITANGV